MCHDENNFVSINDIRLKAIRYLREIYHHRISKTRMISLNGDSAARGNQSLSED